MDIVRPNYAVISVGENNDYGHPTYDVLNRLNEHEVKVLRTDENGNILFVVGSSYGLNILTGDYFLTNMPLDYRIYVLVLDILLFTMAIVIIIKKEKKKNKHLSGDFLE